MIVILQCGFKWISTLCLTSCQYLLFYFQFYLFDCSLFFSLSLANVLIWQNTSKKPQFFILSLVFLISILFTSIILFTCSDLSYLLFFLLTLVLVCFSFHSPQSVKLNCLFEIFYCKDLFESLKVIYCFCVVIFVQSFIAINFPLNTNFAAFHKFAMLCFPFYFSQDIFQFPI